MKKSPKRRSTTKIIVRLETIHPSSLEPLTLKLCSVEAYRDVVTEKGELSEYAKYRRRELIQARRHVLIKGADG